MSESRVVVETPDGPMEGYFALPGREGRFPAVLVAQEAFGVNGHIESVCRRLAERGYAAFAPELYHRQGSGIALDYSNFDGVRPYLGALTNEGLESDLASAMSFLDAHPAIDPARIGIVGFCVGGYVSYFAACRTHVSAAVCFYGGGIVTPRAKSRLSALLGESERIRCPVLGLFGEDDASIPLSDVEAIRSRLTELGKEHEIVAYPRAGHAFFCEQRPSFRPEIAADAWKRTLDWLGRFLGAPSGRQKSAAGIG
ncbi:MAG: dienelactone hydrolase family protein [Thermoanaerobaculia bacterium]